MFLPTIILKGLLFRRHDTWRREQVLTLSEIRFRNLLKWAYRMIPFYRDYYQRQGLKEKDLAHLNSHDLPTLTKDTVRENLTALALYPPQREEIENAKRREESLIKVGRYFLIHSSGSTGAPTDFLYSPEAIALVQANFLRLCLQGEIPLRWTDLPPRVLFVSSVGRGYASTTLALLGFKSYHARFLILPIEEALSHWPKKLANFTANFLAGYPSCLKILGELNERGITTIRPKKVITGGEPLTKEDASFFARVFASDIIDYYGSSESLFIGAGGNTYEGIYLYDDMNYVETDALGRLIITPLYNKAFPLLRYQLNDIVLGFTKEGKGPLPYTHVEKILGRNEEMMWFKNEQNEWDFLHPLSLDDFNVPGLRAYQFIQDSDRSFHLKVMRSPEIAKDELKRLLINQLLFILRKKRLQNVQFTVEFVSELKIDEKTGKFRLVEKSPHINPMI